MKTSAVAILAAVTLAGSVESLAHDFSELSGPPPGWSVAAHAVPADLSARGPTLPPAGNGALMAASFSPFKPKVRYFWDGTYFYEESDGLPDRTRMPDLMVGITSWQQQVPLPTSYFASTTNGTNDPASLAYRQPNYWKLRLVPIPATSPIPISAGNFQRGAIALAADGVPIFNPANNTGRISYEIGELDAYGGHCGLGDDYHYHIAPVHLLPVLGDDKPIAWALDGYPMYGYVEPDGSTMRSLDSDGGHDVGSGWGYHYHARGTFNASTGRWTPSAPYMNAAFHGTVVNYGGQVDPQPTASGLRASGTGGYTAVPVPGATITAFKNPVALSTDGSGNLVENPSGTPSEDQYLMRYTVSGTSYDLCWKLNRNENPKTLTMTWRLPTIVPTTRTYTNSGSRITTYPMAASSLVRLPDTGQTLDATNVFGEDSDYTINPPSLTDNGDGTVTDKVTGLMWQRVDGGESTWEGAVSGSSALRLGGYSDWRLPTPTEAMSLLNFDDNRPALDPMFESSSGTADYWWTSDTYGSDATKVWATNAGGGLGPKPKSETVSAGGTLRYHARYVRGARPSNGHDYTNNGDGTITDTDTNLMWTQAPSQAMTWKDALSYAEGLTLAGYSDWRLPNVKELQTLVDLTQATATGATTSPSLNRILFPLATATAYWSSTSQRAATPTSAWLVELGVNTSVPASAGPARGSQGIVSYETYSSTHPVLAVRTASSSSSSATSSVTRGRATTVTTNLFPGGQRVAGVGSITGADGTVWTVPSATSFANGRRASDLYNDASGVTPSGIGSVDLSKVPIVEVDADGEVVTGYLFSDNYFELYVNGTLVGVDPVPYTPFNSSVVRFRAKRPITYAVRLVDWEENLGLGTEVSGGNAFHAGDGGFIASFSDGTVTGSHWKAQSFYIAPLVSPDLVTELANGTHDSSAASSSPTCNESCYALHYPVPAGWFAKSFADAGWPAATTFTEAAVGVNDKPAYTRFPAQFGSSGAKFIWSSNLVLDNEVLVRYTGPGPDVPAGVSTTRFLPIVLDVTGRTRYTSELTLTNGGASDATVQLSYTAAALFGGQGSGSVTVALPAGRQLVLEDAIGSLRSRGLAIPTGSQGGSLRVRFDGLSSEGAAYAGVRITAPAESGRAGVAYAGPRLTDLPTTASSWLFGLRSSGQDRTNVAFANASTSSPITLRLVVTNGDGTAQRTSLPDVTLGPGQWTQVDDVLSGTGFSQAYASVSVVSGPGPYFAYAVFNDAGTNDGSFVPFEVDPVAAETRLLPVVVETGPYTSELVLTNTGSRALTVELSYVESGSPAAGAGGLATETLAAGEQSMVPDLLNALRTKVTGTLGPKGGSYVGTLSARFLSGGTAVSGYAGARTGSPARAGAGRYGLFYGGIGASSRSRAAAFVYGLRQDVAVRANVAVSASPENPEPVSVYAEVYDGETGRLAGTTEKTVLSPGAWKQWANLLPTFGVTQGYVKLVNETATGTFAAYGVVNDGPAPGSASGTDDGSYIAGIEGGS